LNNYLRSQDPWVRLARLRSQRFTVVRRFHYSSPEITRFPFDSDDGNRSDRFKRLASSKTERTTNSIAQFVIFVTLTPTGSIAYNPAATITRNHQQKILQLTTSSHSELASIFTNAIALLEILLFLVKILK
jgi:hypothetical protein